MPISPRPVSQDQNLLFVSSWEHARRRLRTKPSQILPFMKTFSKNMPLSAVPEQVNRMTEPA